MTKTLKKYQRPNRHLMADRLLRKAKRTLVHDTKLWAKESDGEYMVKMVNKDFKDMQRLATYIRKGQKTQATNLRHDLDTSVREDMPDSVFEWLLEWEEAV